MISEDMQIDSKKKFSPEEVWQYLQETSRLIKESNEDIRQRFQETDKKFQDTDKKFQDTDKKFQDTDKEFQETKRMFQDTDKYLKELGSQIGGLHNKFGFFTEGLMIPSITRILKENFECVFVASNPSFRDNGNSYEIDVLGVSKNACYLVEIKSNLRNDVIEQHNNKLDKFNKFDKRYSDLPKYGIIAATNYQDNDIKNILNAGFYFISLADNIARLVSTDNFIPKKWL